MGADHLPDDFDRIKIDVAVCRHDGHLFDFRLGDKNPVEGVAMMQRKGLQVAEVRG